MNKLASLDKFVTNWDIAINCIKCYNIKKDKHGFFWLLCMLLNDNYNFV